MNALIMVTLTAGVWDAFYHSGLSRAALIAVLIVDFLVIATPGVRDVLISRRNR